MSVQTIDDDWGEDVDPRIKVVFLKITDAKQTMMNHKYCIMKYETSVPFNIIGLEIWSYSFHLSIQGELERLNNASHRINLLEKDHEVSIS